MPDATNSGGPGNDSLGMAIGSLAKSFGQGAGRILADTLSGGKAEEIFQKKQAQTQAELLSSMKDRGARGEAMTSDDYNAARAAGIDPAVVGTIDRDAMSVHQQTVRSLGDIDTLEHMGALDQKTASLYRLAVHSGDPTVKALVTSSINSQAKLMSAQMGLLGRALTAQASERNTDVRAGAEIKGKQIESQGRVGAAAIGAQSRQNVENQREKFTRQEDILKADAREHLENTKAKLKATFGGNKALAAATKTVDGALKSINTAKAPNSDGGPLDDNTKLATARAANISGMSTGGFADVDGLLSGGAFVVPGGAAGGMGVKGLNGIGLAAGLSPDAMRGYSSAINEAMKALNAGDMTKAQAAMSSALGALPEDVRQSIGLQIGTMLKDFSAQSLLAAPVGADISSDNPNADNDENDQNEQDDSGESD